MNDSTPTFTPEFFNPMSGGRRAPAEAAQVLALDFGSVARWDPKWVLENGRVVELSQRGCSGGRANVAFESEGVAGEVRLEPASGGWVKVEAVIAGQRAFLAFAEQVWEEYELYPAGYAARPIGIDADAPGRIGKRRNWLVLSAAAWPLLAPLANEAGWVRAEPVER